MHLGTKGTNKMGFIMELGRNKLTMLSKFPIFKTDTAKYPAALTLSKP